ncbi:DUF2726 domain-containing protein [Roseateles violae]|uniref:DUF2726 domain-containing protein n=1 Tax=Roseateles violae TaxID=3058042 RepID=A0ABT8E091_9BURK|nr:DUF2726 domain-containing protein [Pelomonas sp. PFR6]MDN3923215.1 DUF2726 domain-containing protein [Pelomonas sp. PFR6]
MKFPLTLIALCAIAFVAILILGRAATGRKGRKATGNAWKRPPLTEREQAMYFRLSQAMPDSVVLAQVAFSALLDTKDRPTRATFNRKMADFVVCSKAFEVIAVVELDDASHRGRESQDAKRAALLTAAGYKVMRFKSVPDTAPLLEAFARLGLPAARAQKI